MLSMMQVQMQQMTTTMAAMNDLQAENARLRTEAATVVANNNTYKSKKPRPTHH